MDRQQKRLSPLAEVELEALAAGREWTRRRIEKNLQALADDQGKVSPPERAEAASLSCDEAASDNECGEGGG
jgi:hypothetical protein